MLCHHIPVHDKPLAHLQVFCWVYRVIWTQRLAVPEGRATAAVNVPGRLLNLAVDIRDCIQQLD